MEAKTIEESPFGSFTDPRDGRVYRTVRIGEQVWMAENLDYGRFVPFEAGREDFPTLHIGRRILVPRKQLEAWMERMTTGGEADYGNQAC